MDIIQNEGISYDDDRTVLKCRNIPMIRSDLSFIENILSTKM